MAVNSLCQRIELPASNVWNTPTTWNEDTGFCLPSGYTLDNAIQLVRGDYIYLIKAGATLRGNLKTKTWDASPVANSSSVISAACFYGQELNNIFILGLHGTGYYTVYADVYSLNTDDMKQTTIKSWPVASVDITGSQLLGEEQKKNLAIYDEKNQRVLFIVSAYCSGYNSEAKPRDRYNTQVRFESYDTLTNTITEKILVNNSVTGNADRENMAYWSAARLTADQSSILYSNSAAEPAKQKTFNLTTLVFDTEINSEIPYYASSATRFDSKDIYFNNNTGIVYDVMNNKIHRPALPNTWVPPGRQTLNLYEGNVIYVGPTATYKLPYITKADDGNLVPVFKIRNGQRFSGEKPLTIYDSSKATTPPTVKAQITTSWQTATKDIEIKRGEYDTPDTYTILIDQG